MFLNVLYTCTCFNHKKKKLKFRLLMNVFSLININKISFQGGVFGISFLNNAKKIIAIYYLLLMSFIYDLTKIYFTIPFSQ